MSVWHSYVDSKEQTNIQQIDVGCCWQKCAWWHCDAINFQKLIFDFCDKLIKVDLPPNSIDVEGWDTLDGNDASTIRIHCACMSSIVYVHFLLEFLIAF